MTEGQPQLKGERQVYDDAYFDTRYENIHWHLERLRDDLSGKGRVVDLGCGRGAGAINLAIRGFSVVAIDSDVFSRKLSYALRQSVLYGVKRVQYIKGEVGLFYPEEGGIMFVKGDIRSDLKLPSESADVVTFFHTWPSKPDMWWREIYSEGARVVKNRGLFVVTVDRETSVSSTKELLIQAGLQEIVVSVTPSIVNNHLDPPDKYLLTARKMLA